ncbi:MAG: hypothetical protein ACI86H_000196, partial [bacterium]
LLSRYFFWIHQYSKALKILKKSEKNHPKITLEKLQVFLFLGQYQHVQKGLQKLVVKTKKLRFRKDILLYWFFLLKGESKKAEIHYKKIQETYLYYPPEHLQRTKIKSFKTLRKLRRFQLIYPKQKHFVESYWVSLFYAKRLGEKSLKRASFQQQLIYQAESALLLKKWDHLKVIAKQLQTHFPDIQDGNLFLKEYYQGIQSKN